MSGRFFKDAEAEGGFFGLTMLFFVPWLLVTFFAVDFVVFGMAGMLKIFAHLAVVGVLLGVLFYFYGLLLAVRGLVSRNPKLAMFSWGRCVVGVVSLLAGAGVLVFLYIRVAYLFLFQSRAQTTILPKFLVSMLGSSWCLIFVVLAVGLLAWGYLALGKCYAERAQVAFSGLWTRGVRIQWWTIGVIYVFSFVLTGVETTRLVSFRNKISNAAGRAMTASALEDYYKNGQEPNGEFWRKVANASTARIKILTNAKRAANTAKIPDLDAYYHVEVPAEVVARWRKVALDSPETHDFESLFDTPLPPNTRDYEEGKLVAVALPDISQMRNLCRLEYWRAHLAATRHDFADAQAALRRMKNVSDRAARDTFQIGAGIWGACETMRCRALAEVVGAGLGDDTWLKEIDAEMAALESRVDEVRLNAVIYGETVMMTDVLDGAWQGKLVPGSVPMNALKWLTPQASWCLARDKVKLTRYMASGLEGPLVAGTRHELGISGIVSATATAERRLTSTRANYRLLRALIAIARERRRGGHWPNQAPDGLPDDPFAPGNAVKYQYGTLEVYQPVWDAKGQTFNQLNIQVNGVRVYSVGPNGKDDGGVTQSSTHADDLALWFITE